MRKLFLLVFALVALSVSASAQSDCGNCWVVGGPQCDPLAICDANGTCLMCMEFVACDNPSCNYRSQWHCTCPGLAATPQEKETHAKTILARVRANRARQHSS